MGETIDSRLQDYDNKFKQHSTISSTTADDNDNDNDNDEFSNTTQHTARQEHSHHNKQATTGPISTTENLARH
jgi:hypothetical protein